MMKRFAASAAAAGLALILSGCGSTYDREEAIADIEAETGVDRTTAECIVDGFEEEFGIERLESRGDLTPEEEEAIIEITTDCVLGG